MLAVLVELQDRVGVVVGLLDGDEVVQADDAAVDEVDELLFAVADRS